MPPSIVLEAFYNITPLFHNYTLDIVDGKFSFLDVRIGEYIFVYIHVFFTVMLPARHSSIDIHGGIWQFPYKISTDIV